MAARLERVFCLAGRRPLLQDTSWSMKKESDGWYMAPMGLEKQPCSACLQDTGKSLLELYKF